MDEQQLPPGWELAPIEEIARTATGGTPRRNRDEYYGGNIPWVKSGDLTDGVVTVAEEFITPEGLKNSNAKIFPKGAICIALYGATVGKLGVLDMDAATNQAVCGIFPHECIEPRYLFHSLRNLRTSLIDQAQGGAQPNISNGIIKQTEIPIPPLPEQRRIVAKIEALQERSGRAAKALEEVGPLLEQFRQSILAAAFSGRLTADWREKNPNVEPAHELLARIRTERRERWEQAELAKYEAKGKQPPKDWKEDFEQSEPLETSGLEALPDSWCWCRVKDIGDVQLGRQRAPRYHAGDNMRPYLRVMNVYEDRIDIGDVMEMDFSGEDFEKYKLSYGDILLNEGQSFELVGRPAIYRDEIPGACFTNTLVRFRGDRPLSYEYPQIVFLAYLKTNRFQRIASRTVNIAHLGAGRFADMEFPLPPLAEQVEIVRRARISLDLIKSLESTLAAGESDLAQLNQSILAKAFRGELVPQDPNDEPASELLARIRREREAEVSGDRVQGSGRKKGAGVRVQGSGGKTAKRSTRSSKAASAATPDAPADTNPEPGRPQRRRRETARVTDPTKVIEVLAEGDGAYIHAEVNGADVSFYTRSGWSIACEIDDVPEEFTRPRESARVASLREIMSPELALLHPENVNPIYLPQLRDWYTWAVTQLPENIHQRVLDRASRRWSDALQLGKPSTGSGRSRRRNSGRLFDA